jgi:hypothetical protein
MKDVAPRTRVFPVTSHANLPRDVCLIRVSLVHAFDVPSPSQQGAWDCRVKQFESKLSEPLLLGLIESPMPIGTVWIPFLSRPFYNRFADLLAIRVSLDEEALVALLNNFDTDRLVRHS